MNTKMIPVRVPENVFEYIQGKANDFGMTPSAYARKMVVVHAKEERLDEAIQKYAFRQWSLGKASQNAELPPEAFMAELTRRGLSLNVTAQDIESSLASLD